MCKCDKKHDSDDCCNTSPLTACEESRGKYSITGTIKKGLGGADSTIVSVGSLSSDGGGSLEASILVMLENLIKASIDIEYIMPPIPIGTGTPGVDTIPGEPVIYNPNEPITLEDFQEFLNSFYPDPLTNPGAQAAISCMVAGIFVGLQGAMRHANTIEDGSCESNRAFYTHPKTCRLALEIKIN